MGQSFSEVLTRAAQLGGPGAVRPVTDAELFKIPHYEEDFGSDRFPAFNGKVVLRYPSFGDEVDIDRLAVVLGGTNTARILAAIQVCLESAPPIWWRPNEEKRAIEPAVDRMPDGPGLLGLYSRWIRWRDTFRFEPAGSGVSGTQSQAATPLGSGEGYFPSPA